MGTDRIKAINAAKQLNQVLVAKTDLVDNVLKTKDTFQSYIDYYQNDILPRRRIKGFKLSPSFLKEAKRKCNVLIKELGHIPFSDISQQDIADYLRLQSSAEVFNSYRTLLIQIFKQAISDGKTTTNLAERIMKADTEHTKRSRLSLDEYIAIYHNASKVIQNAMELSLNTMQRRTDIQFWRFDYDRGDGYIYLIQSKTRKYGKAAYLRIPVNLPVAYSESGAKILADIIGKCRDEKLCPFVIHQMPLRRANILADEKDHFMQLSGDQLSRGVSKARIKAGVAINDEFPPTFHELISLGEYLRKKQGWTIQQIQILRGHSSEKMTLKYLEGQDWSTVELVKSK